MGEAVIYFSCSFVKHERLKSGRAHLWQKKSLLLLFFRRKFSLEIVFSIFFRFFITSKFIWVWETKETPEPYTYTYCSEEKLLSWIETESSFLYSCWARGKKFMYIAWAQNVCHYSEHVSLAAIWVNWGWKELLSKIVKVAYKWSTPQWLRIDLEKVLMLFFKSA